MYLDIKLFTSGYFVPGKHVNDKHTVIESEQYCANNISNRAVDFSDKLIH